MATEHTSPDEQSSSELSQPVLEAGQTLGTTRRGGAKKKRKKPLASPKDFRPYEPLMRYYSRSEATLIRRLNLPNQEHAREAFYISYFLNNHIKLRAIGLHYYPEVDPATVLKTYVNDGFMAVQAELRNDYRTQSLAKKALSNATSAWLQHLKRSCEQLKQISPFIQKKTYEDIQDFHKWKQSTLAPGHTISQEAVIEYLIIAGLSARNSLGRNADSKQ